MAFFAGQDLSPWEFRISAQLSCAYEGFCEWEKADRGSHDIKKFSRRGFSMYTMAFAWPMFKSRAHNCLVLCRCVSSKCTEVEHTSEYARLRAHVLWAWTEIYRISNHPADLDFHTADELKQLDRVCELILHGAQTLASINSSVGKHRWKTISKLHELQHINEDVQGCHGPAKTFSSWLDEENMGKFGKVAGATHALTVYFRTLEKWCMQFFNLLDG